MNTIEIILTAAGTAATVVGCLYAIIKHLMSNAAEQAVTKDRIDRMESGMELHEKIFGKQEDDIRELQSQTEGNDAKLRRLETGLQCLPCDSHGDAIKGHGSDIAELKSLSKMNNDMLVELSKWAMKADSSMIEKLARKSSPLKMTKAGEELYRASHADEALKRMKVALMAEMTDASPRTEYDVEQEALNALLRNIGREEFDPVKRFIYYSPGEFSTSDGESVKFDLYAIIKLMSIDLRDIYLAEKCNKQN